MMKRIFGLLVIGCVLYACSPILKYGKYSYKCRGLRGPYECSYITINPDSTYRSYSKFDAGAIDWTGKWSRIGNTLYAEETKDSMMRAIDSVILGFIRPPQRDTLIIKKNRLITETQKIKWKKGNKWETGRFIFYVITVVHSYFHRRCKASSVFLFYSEKYSPLGRPGKSSRVRVCPQVLPVFLAEKPCGQPRPRL